MGRNIRVVIPKTAEARMELSQLIIDKHILDGVDSKLKTVDMTKFASITSSALLLHEEGQGFSTLSETATQLRNNAMGISPGQTSSTEGTLLFYFTSISKFFKGNFVGEEQKMGEWGFTVNISKKGNPSVIIPRSNPDKMLKLGVKISKKHLADGVDSLLTDDFDMVDFNAKLALAISENTKSTENASFRERNFQKRDLLCGIKVRKKIKNTSYFFLTSIRDILLGIYNGTENMLSDWGFDVITNSTPPPPPPPVGYAIQGYITNASTSAPVGDAVVVFVASIGPKVASSNALGAYEMIINITADETATVNINAPGYIPYAAPVELTPGGAAEFNFALTPDI